MFADESIETGERIQYIRGKIGKKVTHNSRDSKKIDNWIGVGNFSWIQTAGTPFRYINHSCEPNAAIVGTKTVIALRQIAKDSEITIDYSMTDSDPYWSMDCHCGAKTCRGYIRPIYTVSPEVFQHHMPYITKYFQKVYHKAHLAKAMGRS